LRQLAEQNGAPPGAWLHIAAALVTEAGGLPMAEFLAVVGQLAALRHGHVTLTMDTLVAIAILDDPRADWLFAAATQYLGGPNADRNAHQIVGLETLVKFWMMDLPDRTVGRLTGRILERLIDGREDALVFLAAVHGDLAAAAKTNPHYARAAAYVRGWVRGHFLPIDLGPGPGAYP
ncbi:MAG: hypothetical protein JWP86_2336, partial [Phenylobacterium sp.]|nr:hypothetical protein [Phenylobacterium sp.]